jgi:hypothetical protein
MGAGIRSTTADMMVATGAAMGAVLTENQSTLKAAIEHAEQA